MLSPSSRHLGGFIFFLFFGKFCHSNWYLKTCVQIVCKKKRKKIAYSWKQSSIRALFLGSLVYNWHGFCQPLPPTSYMVCGWPIIRLAFLHCISIYFTKDQLVSVGPLEPPKAYSKNSVLLMSCEERERGFGDSPFNGDLCGFRRR